MQGTIGYHYRKPPLPPPLSLLLSLPLRLLNLLFILAVNSCSVLRYSVMFSCVVKLLMSSFDCEV